jgi:cytochrome c-type biogenesis protein CcmE
LAKLTRKQKRLAVIGGLAVVVAIAAGFILTALRDQIIYFYSPTELLERDIAAGQPVRIGGLVKDGSCARTAEALSFVVTDGANETRVAYNGITPDLFREGQGVIAEGSLNTGGEFEATTILAKHDENYMPKEVADALREQGEWYGEGEQPVPPPSAENACR